MVAKFVPQFLTNLSPYMFWKDFFYIIFPIKSCPILYFGKLFLHSIIRIIFFMVLRFDIWIFQKKLICIIDDLLDRKKTEKWKAQLYIGQSYGSSVSMQELKTHAIFVTDIW